MLPENPSGRDSSVSVCVSLRQCHRPKPIDIKYTDDEAESTTLTPADDSDDGAVACGDGAADSTPPPTGPPRMHAWTN